MASRLGQSAPDWTLRPAEAGQRELAALAAGRDAGDVIALSGVAATKSAAMERLAAAGVIHLAAPFRLSHGNVLFSSMPLAPPSPASAEALDPAQATLDLRDVINATLRARATVISDGAVLSMRDSAADAGTLQWAWRGAGVPVVVLSRWATDDAAAEAFLRELHGRLAAGEPVQDAMLKARQAVRRSDQWAAPYYWCGWIEVGG